MGVRFCFYLPPELAALVTRVADDLMINPTWLIRRAVIHYLSNLEAGNDIAAALSFQVEVPPEAP